MTYTMKKHLRDGLMAVTEFDMGPAQESVGDRVGQRKLKIETSKGYQRGTLKTMATACLHFPDGVFTHLFGAGTWPGNDFRATVKVTACKRVTEKAIRAQHEALAGEFAAVLTKAHAHYGAAVGRFIFGKEVA